MIKAIIRWWRAYCENYERQRQHFQYLGNAQAAISERDSEEGEKP